jgi:hypothetical protein
MPRPEIERVVCFACRVIDRSRVGGDRAKRRIWRAHRGRGRIVLASLQHDVDLCLLLALIDSNVYLLDA